MLCALVEAPRRPVRPLADRSRDARRLRVWLRARRIRAVIPESPLAAGKRRRRRGRPPLLDRVQYARYNAAERMRVAGVGVRPEHRNLTTRFDERPDSFLAMVKPAASGDSCVRRFRTESELGVAPMATPTARNGSEIAFWPSSLICLAALTLPALALPFALASRARARHRGPEGWVRG